MINPNGTGNVKHECSLLNTNLANENDQTEETLQSAAAKVMEGERH